MGSRIDAAFHTIHSAVQDGVVEGWEADRIRSSLDRLDSWELAEVRRLVERNPGWTALPAVLSIIDSSGPVGQAFSIIVSAVRDGQVDSNEGRAIRQAISRLSNWELQEIRARVERNPGWTALNAVLAILDDPDGMADREVEQVYGVIAGAARDGQIDRFERQDIEMAFFELSPRQRQRVRERVEENWGWTALPQIQDIIGRS
jgi:hypothetical protein